MEKFSFPALPCALLPTVEKIYDYLKRKFNPITLVFSLNLVLNLNETKKKLRQVLPHERRSKVKKVEMSISSSL